MSQVAVAEQGKKIFFPNLDGLRFIAFFTVFLQHGRGKWTENFPQFTSIWHRLVVLILHLGGEGVSLFFVLSGFLITYLLIHEKNKSGRINILFFYMRRALRIWPLYYLLALLNFTFYDWLCDYLGWKNTALSPLLVGLFLTNFDILNLTKAKAIYHTLINPSWSVAIEEQFYLVWPVLFSLVSQKLMRYVFPAIIVIAYVFRFVNRHDPVVTYFHTLSVCGDLAMGGMFAYLIYYSNSFKAFIENIKKPVIVLAYICGLVWMFFVLGIKHNGAVDFTFRLGNCLFFSFIILEQNFSKSSFYKFSNFKLISRWGKYTYGLYLLHLPVIRLTTEFFDRVVPGFNTAYFINDLLLRVITLAISMLIAYLSYHFFEIKFLKIKERYAIIKTASQVKDA